MAHLAGHFQGHRGQRPGVGELLDSLKGEFDTLVHDVNMYKAQRDDYERKLQQQLGELSALQQAVVDVERNYTIMKQRYEEEIQRLHKQIIAAGGKVEPRMITLQNQTTVPTYGGLLSSGNSSQPNPDLPPLNPIADNKSTHEPPSLPSLQPKSRNDPQPTPGNDWMVGYNSAVTTKHSIDLVHTLSHPSVVCCVRFSVDGKFLATGCNRTAQIFDATTGEKLETFIADETVSGDLYLRSVAFSPDGKLLATGAEDNKIRIFQISPKKLISTLEGHELDIYSLDFSGDGRFIVSGSGDKKAIVWDVQKGTPIHILGNSDVGPMDGVTSVAISPDGRYVAAGSLDRIVRLWDAQTGYYIDRFDGHADSVYSVNFSPDGKTLVTGSLDRTLKVWDVAGTRSRGRCQTTLTGHKDFVLSVTYSPDGQWLISGSKDRSVQFWNPQTRVSHIMLQGHKNSVISVAHSPVVGSSVFATGSGDCRARVWSYKTYT